MQFIDRLAQAVKVRRSAVLVGLDPRQESLPRSLLAAEDAKNPAAVAAAYRRFCEGVIDVVAPLVPAVKPQAAFFEQLGPPGMEALRAVVQHARSSGLLVILDGKRNDIGSTAEAYADGWLGAHSAWGGDALTVNPYLGEEGLRPFIKIAASRNAGLFVLVKTSNPGGGMFQDLICENRPLYRHVAEQVESLAVESQGECGFGAVGAVIGATYPQQLVELRAAMPHAWFLVPGYGAQGGAAADVAAAFDASGMGAIVNNSRGIIFAHSRPEYAQTYGEARWQAAVEAATREMNEQLRVVVATI